MKRDFKRAPLILLLGALAWACQSEQTGPVDPPMDALQFELMAASSSGHLSGAIFTTVVDGSIVNENVHYEKKEDVYLDGGPGPNAPATAAGLPEGDYYFQVTDPSGKDLLSTDHISCRMIHVNEYGVIDFVYAGTDYEYKNGKDGGWEEVACQHNQGVDIDHSELGAITVQLFPYDDTPNPGGVYKAWVTPVEQYVGDPDFVPTDKKDLVNGESYEPGNYHGFIPRWSKTDNYKVKQKGPPLEPPEITVRKFHDKDFDGVWDEGEEEVTGWRVDYTDPLTVASIGYTAFTVAAQPAGTWTFVEETPAGTKQTVSILDGAIVSQFPSADPTVTVTVGEPDKDQETHEIIYGNVGLGKVKACKVYDRDGDGVADAGEPGVEGWKMKLTGTQADGTSVGPVYGYTGSNGCVAFTDLLPGSYTVEEIFTTGDKWVSTGATSKTIEVVSTLSGAVMSGGIYKVTFTNYCECTADFDTKGYWHNKNGLSELTVEDRDYVNGLSPYSSPSSYFDAGDEPFDGEFTDGTLVAAAFNNDDGSIIWGMGTWQAEVSHFLVDANAGGDPREQLAQQLLAFIFNARHRLDDPGASIWDGSGWVVASDLIDDAIAAWLSGSDAERIAIKDTLDAFNNNDAVKFIAYFPCDVIY